MRQFRLYTIYIIKHILKRSARLLEVFFTLPRHYIRNGDAHLFVIINIFSIFYSSIGRYVAVSITHLVDFKHSTT